MSEDAAVEALKNARGSAAELKLKLVNLRAELPASIIFVFEGDDDRGVYYSWVRYLDASFRYEPFSCKGKAAVLRLKQALDRDASGLNKGVYFFIDRDFDDSKGASLDDSIYMTDQYSIENYLVNASVLDEVLKIEFHCHAAPQNRASVAREFERMYGQFLSVSTEVNRELYAARALGVELQEDLGAGISKFARVTLNDVERVEVDPSDVVKPVRPITEEEKVGLSAEFDQLEPRTRYRGKFALSFFLRWLDLLARDRREQNSDFFKGLDGDVRVRSSYLSVTTLAARSGPPEGFRNFFSRVIETSS